MALYKFCIIIIIIINSGVTLQSSSILLTIRVSCQCTQVKVFRVCELLNTLIAVKTLRDSALYTSTIDIDIERQHKKLTASDDGIRLWVRNANTSWSSAKTNTSRQRHIDVQSASYNSNTVATEVCNNNFKNVIYNCLLASVKMQLLT